MIIGFFPGLILTDDFTTGEIHVDSCISDSEQDTIQAKEEPAQNKQTLWHDTDLDGKDGDPIIGKFVFVQNNLVEQKDRLRLFQSVERNKVIRAGETRGSRRELLNMAGQRKTLDPVGSPTTHLG